MIFWPSHTIFMVFWGLIANSVKIGGPAEASYGIRSKTPPRAKFWFGQKPPENPNSVYDISSHYRGSYPWYSLVNVRSWLPSVPCLSKFQLHTVISFSQSAHSSSRAPFLWLSKKELRNPNTNDHRRIWTYNRPYCYIIWSTRIRVIMPAMSSSIMNNTHSPQHSSSLDFSM